MTGGPMRLRYAWIDVLTFAVAMVLLIPVLTAIGQMILELLFG